MSETFLIIDMMLGSQGLSSTYEQAHVDLDFCPWHNKYDISNFYRWV